MRTRFALGFAISLRAGITALLFGLLPLYAVAQPTADTTVVLPEVTIEGERERAAETLLPGRVTTLGTAAFAATDARSVADLLAARTSLFLKRYGDGGLATVSFRGTNASQTLIVLDGQRLADPQSGQIDLSLVPTVVLASAEVTHGAGASLYGSDGIGGVVHLRTLEPTAKPSMRLVTSRGAFGGERYGGVVTGSRKRWAGVLAAEYSTAEGDFSFLNETLFPAEQTRRVGADRSLMTWFAKAAYRTNTAETDLTLWYNQAERGLPGPGNAEPSGARQWDDHMRVLSQHSRFIGGGRLQLNASAQLTKLRYRNPHNATDNRSQTQAYALTGHWHRPVHQHWLLTSVVDLGYDAADLGEGHEQTRAAVALRGVGEYERFLVYPTVRFDHYAGTGRQIALWSPRFGINVQPLRTSSLRLKASVGRAFRAPTFNERFWQPGGNPDLEPERGWTTDAGIVLSRTASQASWLGEVNVFYTHLNDQIIWHPSLVGAGVQVWSPANLNTVVTQGLEASAEGRYQGWRGGFIYTFTQAEDRSDRQARTYGQQLRYVPREQVKAWLGFSGQGMAVDVHTRFVGQRFITSDESQALSAYHVVDAQLRYTRQAERMSVTLGLYLENLLDARYSVIRFYPMPPRHARVSLTLHLHTASSRASTPSENP